MFITPLVLVSLSLTSVSRITSWVSELQTVVQASFMCRVYNLEFDVAALLKKNQHVVDQTILYKDTKSHHHQSFISHIIRWLIQNVEFGLNHGFTKQPRETDTFAIAEHCWEQLLDFNVFKDINHSLQRIRNLLRGFAFNYLNFATDFWKLKASYNKI